MRTAEEEWAGIDPKKVALLQDLIAAAREQGRLDAVEECANIACAIDSKRGNEAEIAKAIRNLLPNKEG